MHPKNTATHRQLTLLIPRVPICALPGCNKPTRKGGKYCDGACYHRSRIGTKTGRRTGQYFVCEVCGDEFYRYLADITKANKRGDKIRFCSKACDNGRKSATNVERDCPGCGKTFTVWACRDKQSNKVGNKIYCSIRCRDDANKGIRTAREIACVACGKVFIRVPALIKKRNFCSRACVATQVLDWTRGGKGWGNYGHREDIGHFVRSAWEANIARLLILLGVPYEFEPRTFRLPDGTAYRPDFHVAGMFWLEVKGQMTDKAARKIALFRLTYPNETLAVLGEADYWDIEYAFAPFIPKWERPWVHGSRQRTADKAAA